MRKIFEREGPLKKIIFNSPPSSQIKSFENPNKTWVSQTPCVFTKNPGYPAFVCLPLRLGNPGMTRRTIDSQSYKDPELVNVKTTIGHVRFGLQGLNEGLTQRLCSP